MTPFDVLGIPANSTVAVAKVAFRRLAMKHHPDHGGSTDAFKQVKEAWEKIEGGYRWTPEPPAPKSTFNPASSYTPRPAPYLHRQRKVGPALPSTFRLPGSYSSFKLEISVDRAKAARGCTIPFTHNGEIRSLEFPPIFTATQLTGKLPTSDVIGDKFGSNGDSIIIDIKLT